MSPENDDGHLSRKQRSYFRDRIRNEEHTKDGRKKSRFKNPKSRP